MTDALKKFREKLLSDESARQALVDGFRRILTEQGLSADDQTMKEFGFTDLDVKDGGRFASASLSTVVVTITA